MEAGAVTGARRRHGLPARACARASTRGLDLPEAAARSAAGLPHGARERVTAAVRRLEGDYAEDEWGFDEEFARLVEPGFDFLYDRWWRVKATGRGERARARPRAAGRATTPGSCPGTRR